MELNEQGTISKGSFQSGTSDLTPIDISNNATTAWEEKSFPRLIALQLITTFYHLFIILFFCTPSAAFFASPYTRPPCFVSESKQQPSLNASRHPAEVCMHTPYEFSVIITGFALSVPTQHMSNSAQPPFPKLLSAVSLTIFGNGQKRSDNYDDLITFWLYSFATNSHMTSITSSSLAPLCWERGHEARNASDETANCYVADELF